MKKFFPRFARYLHRGLSHPVSVRGLHSGIIDVAKFRVSEVTTTEHAIVVLSRERLLPLLEQSRLGLHCDHIKTRLAGLQADDIKTADIDLILFLLHVANNLNSWGSDVSSITELLLRELESPRRIADLELKGTQKDILRIIGSTMRLGRCSPEIASVCCDRLCAWLDRRKVQELIEILEWMKKFKYKHTQLLENLREVILVVPMSDDEFRGIVEKLIEVKRGKLGADEDFLLRLVKFRLATVDRS